MKPFISSNNCVLFLATYPPRECGIATFTNDLATALDKKFNPLTKSRIVAINDNPTTIYNYPTKVVGQIAATNIEDYIILAQKINKNKDIKIVNIQHEFGIFGGNWGDHLIPFLQVIEKPVVITFHSILPDPDDNLKNVVRFIIAKSKAVVVMNELSQKTLIDCYQAPKSKIVLIPHGIPQTPFEPSEKFKTELGLHGKIVLSTFGMLNRGKGIEYAIYALAKIIKQFPNVIYLVLGETHPVVRREEGEAYRNFLNKEVERLNLKNNVKFYNKYLTIEEIVNFLKATDIYISSELGAEQSVSGTLSYALGCGRPVISTPTTYAKYIVKNEKNGIFVGFKKPRAITQAIISLLSDSKWIKEMSGQAYEDTRRMTWPNVAAAYFNIYKKFADLTIEEKKLPEIKLDHLLRLTDNFGLLHHAKYSTPEKRHGYSLDDNARALTVCAKYYRINPQPEFLSLIKTYLNFMRYAQHPNGRFSNIISYQRKKDAANDDDTQGRGIWVLGYLLSQDFLPKEMKSKAEQIFRRALKPFAAIDSPRPIAFAMMGMYFYLKRFPHKNLLKKFKKLADHQVNLYRHYASEDWQWFEGNLTYSNSKLPESLFYAYLLTHNRKYLTVAERTLKFLSQITFEKNYYSPIGHQGWFFRNQRRSYFDQQPEDTASMVETKTVAYKATKNKDHLSDAYKAFQWFLGRNHLNLMVYDEATGGCHDGVGKYALNLNEGAESTLSYLMARLALEDPKITTLI